jgi:predicted PurR-regulated permease PerM
LQETGNKLKALFLIPIAVFLLAIFIVVPKMRDKLVSQIGKLLAAAKGKSDATTAEIQNLNNQASQHQQAADAAASQANNLPDDADWHKK